MTNRRDTWRDFLGRFEPSANPHDALNRGFYVPRPGRSLAEQLAVRFELKPAASHLLMGGVGSGKTTQLLVAHDRLLATGDVNPMYLDVSLYVEPNKVSDVDLLVTASLVLGSRLKSSPDLLEIDQRLDLGRNHLRRRIVLGHSAVLDGIEFILKRLPKDRPHHVLLIDSLDRATDLRAFENLIETAVSNLRGLGIGVILIGPLTGLYGIRRTALDRFDRTWHLPTVDAQNDTDGHEFLLEVLRVRDANNLLTDAAAPRLAVLSGGVLRDLIALTQTAGEEAYVDGAERVEVRHVETAGEIFGRKQLIAVDSQELAVLQRVRTKGTFVQTSEKDSALLATRRVLEYTNGQARFGVHPTIEHLLEQIPRGAVTPNLTSMGAPEAALRLMVRRGYGDWMALVVEPGIDVTRVADELADEMQSCGDAAVGRVRGARDVEDLTQLLAAEVGPVVVSEIDAWPAEHWALFDRLRSRFIREERTALVLSRHAFDLVMREAPNFSSWLGASAVEYQPDDATLTDEERRRRIQALRDWSGLTDDEVLARASAGTLPDDPEYAEWLLLLKREDLLGR